MMLLCSDEGASGGVAPSEIEQALSSLTAGGDVEVSVRPVTDQPTPAGVAGAHAVHPRQTYQ